MIDLSSKYMGLELNNPIIVGASSLTNDMDYLKKIEKAGAGAVVIKSLFEEQIQLERFKMQEDQERYKYRHPEMITIFPEMEHPGPKEHLYWLKKAKKDLSIPVIASLNAKNESTWIKYAKSIEETGVDAIELNFYASPKDFASNSKDIEQEQINIIQKIQNEISIPVSVKLSYFYSNILNFLSRVDKTGVAGVVIFNRLFQPDIDIDKEENIFSLNLSRSIDNRLALRYTGLLSENISADICSTTGIIKSSDVIKMLLAGASNVQIVSALYRYGIDYIKKLLEKMEKWMEEKGYNSLSDFRGKMDKKHSKDPWAYTRAQYVKILMNPEKLLEKSEI
ncbi:MAG: dihydroorotate dehydrogenase-like protein [Candidatus Cloacimonetes bacterium]|nr:dihydroorotate dehydrogenase-like protein [Candidatus Cloacimonadota bacterium]MBS3767416.1 dihydroorotate dehydrogenase-like protein [Candidatus Cloacimonadota bacterium]